MGKKGSGEWQSDRTSHDDFINMVGGPGMKRGADWSGQTQKNLSGGGVKGVVDSFRRQNEVVGRKQTAAEWEAEMKAARARQRSTTGVYNSRTGRRDYSGR